MVRLALFGIGWMTRYRRFRRAGRIVNGGNHVVRHETGGELENSLPRSARHGGYAWLPGATLTLEHLGGSADVPSADDASAVLSATRPGGPRDVVGWYRNARCRRAYQPRRPCGSIAEAKANDC